MNFSCPQCQPCELINAPYTNLTSEGPDPVIYFSTIYTYDGVAPPPICTSDSWTSKGCKTTCESTISQDDADACARRQEIECVPNPTPIPNPKESGGNPQRFVYYNEPQSSTSTCPDGTRWTFTIPRGRYPAYSLIAANNIARFYAQQDAVGHKICFSDLLGSCQADGTVQLFITATGNHVDAGIMGLGTNLWQVASGSIPDGLSLKGYPNGTAVGNTGFAGSTLILSGTPTTVGIYAFTIYILLTNGDYAYKDYIIEVMDSIIQGHSVSILLTPPGCAAGKIQRALGGSVPPGMGVSQTINGDDQLTGTATTSGCCAFTITYS